MVTEPYFEHDQVALYLGDCLDVLREMPDESVDAVVCDPPYALAELSTALVLEAIGAWMGGDRDFVPQGRGGFMGRDWDRFVPPPGVWDECLRVLKPGGHLLAFAGARTVDLMGLSIRIAGFEIRDGIEWIYGSGMPKGQNISKAIDKAAGAAREVVGASPYASRKPHGTWTGGIYGGEPAHRGGPTITAPATNEAQAWEGWNTSLRPAHEPIIMARKPVPGTVAANVVEHGTGALNIGACRVEGGSRPLVLSDRTTGNNTYGDGLHGSYAAGETTVGRWPTNLVFTHSAACVEDGPCALDCPVGELDRQSGVRRSGGNLTGSEPGARFVDAYGECQARTPYVQRRDEGGASRYFPTFRYEAKAPASERPKLPDGTAHPTVKPLELMRWLVRLVTPPGGVVLDPFAGSGTTGEAVFLEGFDAVLVEREREYCELIKARLSKPMSPTLFGGEW